MKTLIVTGYFSWNAVERRSDRYGSVRINDENGDNILLDEKFDLLEGKKGKLIAEVILPVKSQHIGDLARGFYPSLPEMGEIVVLGEGELFIEHNGRPDHEKSTLQFQDDEMQKAILKTFQNMGATCSGFDKNGAEPPEVYDLIGLKPDDGRNTDWLNPEAFYRLHMSKINLYFEELT